MFGGKQKILDGILEAIICTGSQEGVHEAEYSETEVMQNWGSLAEDSVHIIYSSSEGGRFCFTFLQNDALKL